MDLVNIGFITVRQDTIFNMLNNPLRNLSNGTICIASLNTLPVSLTVEDGFTNHGTIELSLDVFNSNRPSSTLSVLSGTLINAPGGTLRSTQPAANTGRTIDAIVDNRGTIDVEHQLAIVNENRTFISTSGTISVDDGKTLSIVGGSAKLGSGTTFLGAGVIDFAGPPMTLTLVSDVTNQAGGVGPRLGFSSNVTIEGPGTLTNEGSLTFHNETVNVDLINDGFITVRQGVFFNMLNNPLANLSDGTIRIAPATTTPVTLTVQEGFTNEGTIELSLDVFNADTVGTTLSVVNGTLINAPSGTLLSTQPRPSPPNTGRTIDATVDNQGTIDVQYPLDINHAAASHFNRALIKADQNLTILQPADGAVTNTIAGVIDIAAGITVTVSGGSCINKGVVTGAGTFICP